MIKKVTEPILSADKKEVVGTKAVYRVFGITVMVKIFHTPQKYGIKEWSWYQVI
jgi:hypothetical protein